MEFFIKYIFPTTLTLGAIFLAFHEIIGYNRLKAMGFPPEKLRSRMIRRMLGTMIIILVAVMVFWGVSNLGPLKADNWKVQAKFWLIVIGMVLFTVLLAVWDVMDGIKNLEQSIDKGLLEQLTHVEKMMLQGKIPPEQAMKQVAEIEGRHKSGSK